MNFSTVIVALCVASSSAAPARKRNKQQHKSLNEAGARDTESYDPYLGVGGRNLAESMSMSTPVEAPAPAPSSAAVAGAAASVLAAAGVAMLL